jgi:hypothetical protein
MALYYLRNQRLIDEKWFRGFDLTPHRGGRPPAQFSGRRPRHDLTLDDVDDTSVDVSGARAQMSRKRRTNRAIAPTWRMVVAMAVTRCRRDAWMC